MKRTNSLFKPLALAALLMTLGTGAAVAAEPIAPPQDSSSIAQAPNPTEAQSTMPAEVTRLAWDRVGSRAGIMMI